MDSLPYSSFHSIPRLNRDCLITEKIDGINCSIQIFRTEDLLLYTEFTKDYCLYAKDGYYLFAGSKNRWLKVGTDTFGFASWCTERAD